MERKELPVYLGVVGNPVRHSLSPRMHKRALQKLKIEGFYLAFEVEYERFEEAILGARSLGFRGLNITLPFKERAFRIADITSEEVRVTRSANTFLFDGGVIKAFNTDIYGFETAVEKKAGEKIEGKSVAVLGAGGVARTILYSLIRKKAGRISLFNRTYERSKKLKEEFEERFGREIEAHPLSEIDFRDFDIVINATSLGWNDENLFDIIGRIPPRADDQKKLFFDTVYRKTPFLKIAQELGHRAIDGKWMLVLQGAKSFEIWLGVYPPEDEMYSSIKRVK